MPLTPIPGIVPLRALQLGKESTSFTAVAATRRMPWTMSPDVNPNWTAPSNDTGTVDEAQAPFRMALDITGSATGQLTANDAPTVLSAGVVGGISPATSGTAKIYTATPASLTQDVFDTYTGESFDDASSDAWQFAGGVINDFALEYPQDGGPINLTANWRFGAATYPGTPTGSLTTDAAPTYLYCTDTQFYIDDTAGGIETTQLSDIVYSANFAVQNNLDVKRFANGTNTRFQVRNYGRGKRAVTLTLVGAKQSAWLAEAVKWFAASPTERFFGLKTLSTVAASVGIPYSLDIRMPGYWLTRAAQDVNSNTAFSLTAQNIYDSTLTYPFKMVATTTRASL